MPDVQGAAISTTGQTAEQTTKVISSIQGENELQMTFGNTAALGTADKTVIIRQGADRATFTDNGGANTFQSDFNDYASLQAYFRQMQTMVNGIRITTDMPANFDGYLLFTVTTPDGQKKTVKRTISTWKQPLGGGTYGNELIVPAEKLSFLFWGALEVAFVGLKPQSSITFHFPVKGWNKSSELSPLTLSSI